MGQIFNMDKKVLSKDEISSEIQKMQLFSNLAVSEDVSLRKTAAEHVDCPQNILNGLSEDEESSIRIAVAKNPSTSLNVLYDLLNDDCADVRESVLGNPKAEEKMLIIFMDDCRNLVEEKKAFLKSLDYLETTNFRNYYDVNNLREKPFSDAYPTYLAIHKYLEENHITIVPIEANTIVDIDDTKYDVLMEKANNNKIISESSSLDF